MSGRFAIYVREYGSDHDVLLCTLSGGPTPTVEGLRSKTLMIEGNNRRRSKIPKYTEVRVENNA